MLLADRLTVPGTTKAILWDMDGVLLDTLGLDLNVCNQLLQQHFGEHVTIERVFIRSIFAYDPPEFWQRILHVVTEKFQLPDTETHFIQILEAYNQLRKTAIFDVLPGISEILHHAKMQSLKNAVVSNNPTEDVKHILAQSRILTYFDQVIGNDLRQLAKKPAPDTYLFAAERLRIAPERCVVVEDSLLGVEAGYRAGCITIGVATGGTDFQTLEKCIWTQQVYSSFQPNRLFMTLGNVTKKTLITPNDFVTHMLEHIAWRVGSEIDLYWNNNDWYQLGRSVGEAITQFEKRCDVGVALGMIDDGSAEVFVNSAEKPDVQLTSIKRTDLSWFTSLRCEQINSGTPLIELLNGVAEGIGAIISVRVCNVEDPHHTWEGVFRALGIALNRIYTPETHCVFDGPVERDVSHGDISIHARSVNMAIVSRGTAETGVKITVDFSNQHPTTCDFHVAPTIQVSRLHDLISAFAEEAGCSIQVNFNATVLSSSHVAAEDTALVLGRALREILVLRMVHYGINGAGSSLHTPEDFDNQPIRVGVSVEGRKFWKFVPFENTLEAIRTQFVIGQNVCDTLFSEDLDDFLDGLAGGLNCSIIVHIKELINANEGWQMIFRNLGRALKEVFAFNPYRKGVPPGVKATLS